MYRVTSQIDVAKNSCTSTIWPAYSLISACFSFMTSCFLTGAIVSILWIRMNSLASGEYFSSCSTTFWKVSSSSVSTKLTSKT